MKLGIFKFTVLLLNPLYAPLVWMEKNFIFTKIDFFFFMEKV